MKYRLIILFVFISGLIQLNGQATSTINNTDQAGRKQGHWIKKYPNGNIQYEGDFIDNYPVGTFTRYYENKIKMSVLIYSTDGKQADATTFHTNGFIASTGKYINQEKTGKWKFYSYYNEGLLINEEEYSGNIKNGPSIKYYNDGSVAEKLNYTNDIKDGEWFQYHPNGKVLIHARYLKGKLDGKYEAWFDNGVLQISGFYKNNLREGKWYIYDNEGKLKYQLDYVYGITKNKDIDIESTNLIDSLEKNSWKVADPEKTGTIK